METMKPEEQRIAIAEACGWEKIYKGVEPDNRWMTPDGNHYATDKDIPDYLNDLNAMFDAEEMLKEDDLHAYGCYCIELYEEYGDTVHLTAKQRAEAFLKTIGKWV